MKVSFSPRAHRRVRVVAKWWREHRPAAPTLFDDELHQAVDRLRDQPAAGFEYETADGMLIRRVLLPKSAQHVYYALDEEKGVIVILTVWGARRGRAPKL